ncbi:MAG: DUF6350 family protein [Arcanobacterium sp.]|nr:DUF6350 family protein [Arcanobacterium sp.]MDY5589293.1 DUF6350 family protein [Arcanobacterium sp.]
MLCVETAEITLQERFFGSIETMTNQRIDLSRVFFVARGVGQPVLYSWLLTVLFALLFYVTTASAPTLGDATWSGAAQLTTCLWATTFGGRCSMGALGAATPAGTGYVQLPPLALTLLILYTLAVIARKRMVHSWAEVVLVGGVQAALVGVIGMVMRLQGSWWIAVIGAAALGALAALWAGREYLFGEYRWWAAFMPLFPKIKRLGGLLLIFTAVAFAVAICVGARRIVDIHASYFAGVWGGIGLVLVQLLYLPTVLVWVASWLLGAGFSVGNGTYFSIFGTVAQPLPAIPILGALPHNSAWAALVLVPVIAGIAWISWRDWRTLHEPHIGGLRVVAVQALLVVASVGVLLSALAWLSRGALGPGRMAVVGTRAEFMLLAVLAVVGVPYALTAMFAVRQATRSLNTQSARADHIELGGQAEPNKHTAPSASASRNPDSSTIREESVSPDEHIVMSEAPERDNEPAELPNTEQGAAATDGTGEEHKNADSV